MVAVKDFLGEDGDFEVDQNNERFVMTCNLRRFQESE